MNFAQHIKERRHIRTGLRKTHGDAFYTAFDEAFGILYIDLKILGIAVQEGVFK